MSFFYRDAEYEYNNRAPHELSELLYQNTVEQLKPLAQFCPLCQRVTRKDELVRCIHRTMMTPKSLREMWDQLDDLSKKAVAAAYHSDGEFNQTAFVAQYNALPHRPEKDYSWRPDPILLDLFIHDNRLPSDLIPLLADLVSPPEKFQLTGLEKAPQGLEFEDFTLPFIHAETEQNGLHDLQAYLRLVYQGKISITATARRATAGSIKKIADSLLQEDFFPLPAKYKPTDTIRPFGLDVFAQEAGLVSKARGRNQLQLTATGREFYQTQAPEILLEAFEQWTQKGAFDELTRISALKGLKSKSTHLTPPAGRREAVIEALSWCPANVWIDLSDFYRAVKIWQFDIDVEKTPYSNLYIGYKDYGMLYGGSYWTVVKGLYINAVIWEYLASIGAVDLVYTHPGDSRIDIDSFYYDDEYISFYDGLWYFRINNLGAYLLGQAGEYKTKTQSALFSISSDLRVTLLTPENLMPNDRSVLEQMATPDGDNNNYRLNQEQLLSALEAGADLEYLADFLQQRHDGPLPDEVAAWFEKSKQSTQAFQMGDQALFIKTQSEELAQMALNDLVLGKFCYLTGPKTLVIPTNKEKAFRTRLKQLAYVILEK